jgi:hypothetical protein
MTSRLIALSLMKGVLGGNGEEGVVEQTVHLMAREQMRGKGKGWGPTITFKGTPPMI